MPAKINASLQQQERLGGTQHFQIVNGREVRISQGNTPKAKSYSIDILALTDKSNKRIHINKNWLMASIFTLVPAIFLYVLGSVFDVLIPYDLAIIGVLLLAGVCSLVMVIVRKQRVRCFVSRYAKVELFALICANPDKQSVDHFINTLEQCQQRARASWQLKPDQQVAGEMRMLRRLAGQGIISQTLYESAKQTLFTVSSQKSG